MHPDDPLPPYTYVPGGPRPHPTGHPDGHSFGRPDEPAPAIPGDDWPSSAAYLRGVRLFNAGYYWEAHEAWEALWHAHGRRGPVADLLKALIKLAAAGVKVREGQPRGVSTHARRAADLFEQLSRSGPPRLLGLDLLASATFARRLADSPPAAPCPPDGEAIRVFDALICPELPMGTS